MMNVLVLGDEQSHGCGLRAGQLSYVGHLVRQVSRTGQSIQIEVHTPPTAGCLLQTLSKLPLHQYDLILVHTERIADELSKTVFWRGPSWRGLSWPGRPPATLTALLTRLRPFRHTAVLMTPLPHPDRAVRQRRNRLRTQLTRHARQHLFSLFDTSAWLPTRPEYFPDGKPTLNAVSHELLGRSLFDYYQSAPAIVTVQPIRRG